MIPIYNMAGNIENQEIKKYFAAITEYYTEYNILNITFYV